MFPSIKIDDMAARQVLNSGRNKCLVSLYLIASNQIKKEIKEKIELLLNSKDSIECEIYLNALDHNIIESSTDIEDHIIADIEQIKQNEKYKQTLPDPMENILNKCINIYLLNKILGISEFTPYFREYPEMMFLMDMDNFSYNEFELRWLGNFADGLKAKISQNDTARKQIKEIYINAFRSKEYTEKMVEDYIKYFN